MMPSFDGKSLPVLIVLLSGVSALAESYTIPATSVKIDIRYTSNDASYHLTTVDLDAFFKYFALLPESHLKSLQFVEVSPFTGTGCSTSVNPDLGGILLGIKPGHLQDCGGFFTMQFFMPLLVYPKLVTGQQKAELRARFVRHGFVVDETLEFQNYYVGWLYDSSNMIKQGSFQGSSQDVTITDPFFSLFIAGLFTDWTKQQIATYSGLTTQTVKIVPTRSDQTGFGFNGIRYNFKNNQIVSWQPTATSDPVPLSAQVKQPLPIPSTLAAPIFGPTTIIPISGDNQIGGTGRALTVPMTVRLTGASDVPLAGVTVSFVITSGLATVPTRFASTDANGVASATLTLGNAPTKVTVEASVPALKPIQFIASTAELKVVSGDAATSLVGSTLRDALTARVVAYDGSPAAGLVVNFTVESGAATVNPASAKTGADGVVSTKLTFGAAPGPVVVATSAGTLAPVKFSLASVPDPGGFLATASFTNQIFAGKFPLGDNGPAAQALLLRPSGLAFDSSGNLYIADSLNARVRKVSPLGKITTVSTLSGPSLSDTSHRALSVLPDAQGNVIVSNILDIRKITPAGAVSVIAGGSRTAYSGDGGLAKDALLSNPMAIVADPEGNLFVADSGNHRIRKISQASIITTIAGTGVAGYSGDEGDATMAQISFPRALAFDPKGNLLIAEGSRIRVLRPDGTIYTLAGGAAVGFSGDGGPAATALLNTPSGLAIDSSGTVFVADLATYRIRTISPSGTIGTLAGTGLRGPAGDGGPASSADLLAPWALTLDSGGGILVADGNQVRRIGTDGIVSLFAGALHYDGDGGPATDALFQNPQGLALDSGGALLVADTANQVIRRIDATGVITTIAGYGIPGFGGDGGPAVAAQLESPTGVALDTDGNILIADSINARIRRVSNVDGTISTIAGTGRLGFGGDGGLATAPDVALVRPTAVTVGPDGTVYIADGGDNRIRAVGPDGVIRTVAGTGTSGFSGDGGPALSAQLRGPTGLAVRPDGTLYVLDAGNSRVRVIAVDGTISTVMGVDAIVVSGDPRLSSTSSVALDSAGNLFVGDLGRVSRLSVGGVVSTILGGGISSSILPDAAAQPRGLIVDSTGRIFVSDQLSHNVRALTPAR